MQIRISKINPPRPGDPEKGWKPTKNYQIFDASGTKFLASQDKNVGSLQEGDMLNIETSQPDRFGNIYIQSFEPIKDINADIKNTFPDSKVVSTGNGYSTIQPTQQNSNTTTSMTLKDFLIVLQSCCNRDTKLTADQKLKFILDNYKAGLVATHKRLSESSDSF
tara:strand:- start:252 stop:743 length:492 start_codon:yes stop_codon:yes gene_type:complete